MPTLNLAQRQFQEIAKGASIKICTQYNSLLGTGIFVLPNLILTCHHVIKHHENIQLFYKNGNIVNPNGKENIKAIHKAADKDLALIELCEEVVKQNQFCLRLSDKVQMGNDCYSFGFSKIFQNGDAILTKYVDRVGDNKEWIKVKGDQIISGFSGSGVINLKNGHVIGLISETLNKLKIYGGIAVPTETIFKIYPELKEKQLHFFEQHTKSKYIYKRLLFDYENIDGVDIIDDFFIEYHRNQENATVTPNQENATVTPNQENTNGIQRDFYLAFPNAQWWGVINDLTVDKEVFSKIIDFINDNFNHSSSIISLLYGSGGMGKSTTARKLIYHFKKQFQCIWIDDLLEDEDCDAFFKDFLPNLLDNNIKTLIVLDDWGKLTDPIKGKFKRLFKRNYKNGINNLKFIITGKRQHINDILLEWQVPNAKTYFNVAEDLQIDNGKLLNKFIELFPNKNNHLLEKEQLIKMKPFHLLFVLIRGMENEVIQESLSEKREYNNYFQEIINFDLNEMFKDNNRKGFVYALIFTAYLSHKQKQKISKSTFLRIADHYNSADYSVLKNKKKSPVKNWEVLRFYISEFHVRKKRDEDSLVLIRLNKDDFHEAILNADLHLIYQTAKEFFEEWKIELIEYIIENGSENSSSIVGFVFSSLENILEQKVVIEKLISRKNTYLKFTRIFLHSERDNFTFEDKWKWAKEIKKYTDICNSPTWGQFLISSFQKNNSTTIKEKILSEAKILIQKPSSHPAVIYNCLNILQAEPQTAINEAKILIQKSGNQQVICSCLKILQAEPELAIKEAKQLIQKYENPLVITSCLKILETAEPESAIKEAK